MHYGWTGPIPKEHAVITLSSRGTVAAFTFAAALYSGAATIQLRQVMAEVAAQQPVSTENQDRTDRLEVASWITGGVGTTALVVSVLSMAGFCRQRRP